jgi:peroxiredoxin
MKKILFIFIAVATVLASVSNGFADDTNSLAATTNDIPAELNGIIVRINEKLQQGKDTESDLAGNLKEYDALYARHKGEASPAVVRILLAKADLYTQVLNEPEKAVGVLKQVQHDFPGVQVNGNTDALIESLQKAADVMQIQRSLVMGAPFPNFDEKDINGKPLSVASYRGKVLLIDFWATWCPPCRAELPDILAAYKRYHEQGFEVIGISLDEDRKELEKFLKAQDMTWPQYNDGLFWKTKLVSKYGVEKLPSTFLLDRSGKIIGKDLQGNNLTQAIARALGGT